MEFPESIKQQTCRDCLSGKTLGFEIKMAFQPIVDWHKQAIVAYEALVRGPEGQGAGWVFERINDDNRYYFDQACRVKAIETATRLGCQAYLNINFLPNAVYSPETCIKATIEAADLYGFDLTKLVFEVTESEQIIDKNHLQRIFSSYSKRGFKTAIDDYGSGYARMDWLVDLRPDILKLDMQLIRDIEQHPDQQKMVKQVVQQCLLQGTQVLAEGIETRGELDCILALGIHLVQGYYFAKPELEHLASVPFSSL
ncbi:MULTISPECIES: EAL domain-containing protein [Pseudidiomarina]|uniref:EAL domain-containing protein (Putative c-di-GMP-specific phosphodiesterase class I) n=2 Tax=Pseudidiomarina TaxID=2800384 RepID=A0A368UZL1_9GAMM|nr:MULTISPECIES: EAL domain-containing protein [Pseudidiomarina]PWW14526.1 EAL domain-containing protein (putative c-di-GMP-specific phosphodiesterase class I) [Pseudidiomarina maritima]RBP92474.1 EAL domain-containing protein (putative c-di-GMP-specific phosphodiesterase class I) [Pseudidiomarina tainanensis]RCW34282.1 EAL domain-containing protein (putative c-di-GMP-specific phosphodiesterase class I) [Pseudidiomarina tainanensis]